MTRCCQGLPPYAPFGRRPAMPSKPRRQKPAFDFSKFDVWALRDLLRFSGGAWEEWVGWIGELVTLQWVGGVTQSVARALGAERCAQQCPNGKGAS